MRAGALVFLLAVACLAATCAAWLYATGAGPAAAVDPAALLARFEESAHPVQEVDVAALYAGRQELLDPRMALPTWHQHPRDEAVRVHAALALCPPPAVADVADAALGRALSWHARTCQGGPAPDDELDRPPFVHPSGRSYAALAFARGAPAEGWIRAHARAFHVLELASLDPRALGPDERALAAIPSPAWEAITRGEGLVLTPASLVLARRGPFGLAALRIHRRTDWEAFSRRASVALAPRGASALCARPASADLCWEPISTARRYRPWLVLSTLASAALAVLGALALAAAYARERRRAHLDRIHVLRTLTHELRTPATTLRLDVEPLRAAYDDLPAACQAPLLRVSDGVERLHRVLHRTARYLALFETPGASPERLCQPREIPSARELFAELAEEWPEDVTLTATSEDGPVCTDPEWLGVAVRNLVENAARHGAAPVGVAWAVDPASLVVRVSDAGNTPGFSLRRAVAPFEREGAGAGLGLGLSLVDRVARLLGGRLTHQPSPTVFQLRLPRRGPS